LWNRNRRALFFLLALALLVTAAACHRKAKAETFKEDSILSVEQLWERGQASLEKGRTVTARRYFDQITLREDAGDYKDKASLATADSFFKEETLDGYTEAIARYQTFLSFHPTHPQAAYCQFQIALAYLQEVATPDRDTQPASRAKEAFTNLIENYPNSTLVPEARTRLAQVNDILAAHEIKVGDFYMKNGQWQGAAARYRVVVDKYPGYWNMPLVHFRLAEALAGAGQSEEARIYYRSVVEKAGGTDLAQDATDRLERLDRPGESRADRNKKDLPDDPLLKDRDNRDPWWKFWRWGGRRRST
jgi:outer membrane protein assembly factor BamD